MTTTMHTAELATDVEGVSAWVERMNKGMGDLAVEGIAAYVGKYHVILGYKDDWNGFNAFRKANLIANGLQMGKPQREAWIDENGSVVEKDGEKAWQWREDLSGEAAAAATGSTPATVSRYTTYRLTGEKPTSAGVKTKKNGEPGAGADKGDGVEINGEKYTALELAIKSITILSDAHDRDALKSIQEVLTAAMDAATV